MWQEMKHRSYFKTRPHWEQRTETKVLIIIFLLHNQCSECWRNQYISIHATFSYLSEVMAGTITIVNNTAMPLLLILSSVNVSFYAVFWILSNFSLKRSIRKWQEMSLFFMFHMTQPAMSWKLGLVLKHQVLDARLPQPGPCHLIDTKFLTKAVSVTRLCPLLLEFLIDHKVRDSLQ